MAKELNYTQKTLRENRLRGRICGIVEKWNQYVGPHGARIDLFGFIDIIALDPDTGIVAVQSTGPSGHSTHKKKLLENDNALEWLKCNGTIELWSWRKLLVNRGGKQKRWYPRIEEITLDMFGRIDATTPLITPQQAQEQKTKKGQRNEHKGKNH